MNILDAVAIALLLGAVSALALGEAALMRAQDLEAVYWLVAALVGLRAAVQFGKPGKA